MNNYKFYFFTAGGLIALFLLFSLTAIPYLLSSYKYKLLYQNTQSLKQEGARVSNLLKVALSEDLSKDKAVNYLQESVMSGGQDQGSLFIMDWSGKILAHPDKTKIGGELSSQKNKLPNIGQSVAIPKLLDNITNSEEGDSNIIFLDAIPNSDLVIIGSLSSQLFISEVTSYKNMLFVIFIISALVIMLFVLIMIRWITNHYDQLILKKSSSFEDKILNLAKLNTSLENYQKRLSSIPLESSKDLQKTDVQSNELEKKRLLTYVRNELIPISINTIAYIYVENTITYVIAKDGKRSTTNESLDQLFSYLNEQSFFRVNRQIIVAINAIERITKYGKNQLKIEVTPKSEIDVIIGKNKAATFKQWLDF